MILRPARPDEAEALTALAFRSKGYWGYAPEQLEVWREDLTISSSLITSQQVVVAEEGETLLGCFVLLPESQAWNLDHLWVDPAHMRRGIGRRLMDEASRLARAGGASALAIDADPGAETFYAACGATVTGWIPAPIDGQPDRRRPQMRLNL